MNSNTSDTIPAEQCLIILNEMFPQIDEGVILCALIDSGNSFENTVTALIEYQTRYVDKGSKSHKEAEPEISLFTNVKSGSQNYSKAEDSTNTNTNKNSNTKNINSNRNYNIKRKEIETIQKINDSNTKDIYNNNNNKTQSNIISNPKSDGIGNSVSNIQNNQDAKSKKSFGQKFKNWFSDVFKKEKGPKKTDTYSSLGQNDD